MAAVSATGGPANPEAFLSEVQAVSRLPAETIKWSPPDVAGVDASLQDEILEQPSHGIVDRGGNDTASQSEAAAQSPHDVVFSASLPGPEVPGGMNPLVAGIETNHDLAEGCRIPAAFGCRFQLKNGHSFQNLQIAVGFSTVKRAGWYASRPLLLQQEFP